jgi:hypothetical protein
MLALQTDTGETLRFEAIDARADGQRRTVSLSRDMVVIARRREGVLMRIALAPRAFLGVLLRLVGLQDGAFRFEVRLAHRDPELGVTLFAGDDRAEAHRAWKRFARFVGAPALIERAEGEVEEVAIPGRPRPVGLPRRRARGVGPRRPRFLARRRVGDPALAVPVARGRELFGAWRDGL